MKDDFGKKPLSHPEGMKSNVDKKVERKLKARKHKERSIWFGLGMFGLVGWSVAIPTILGIVVGVWLDHHWPGRISWTLTMLFVGLVMGCMNAWRWVKRESRHE